MTEVLSHEEVDALLNALTAEDGPLMAGIPVPIVTDPLDQRVAALRLKSRLILAAYNLTPRQMREIREGRLDLEWPAPTQPVTLESGGLLLGSGNLAGQSVAEFQLAQVLDLEARMAMFIPCRAVLGCDQMSADELRRIRPGVVLELDRQAGFGADVLLGEPGLIVGRADPVIVDGQIGLRLKSTGLQQYACDRSVLLEVELGRTALTYMQARELGVNSMIELDRLSGQPFDLVANGRFIGLAEQIVIGRNMLAVRVLSVHEKSSEAPLMLSVKPKMGLNVTAPRRKVREYDYFRPDKFTKPQLETLHGLFEEFARRYMDGLSARLRTLAGLHVLSVDQLTCEEFIKSLPNPTALAVVEMNPLSGHMVVELDLKIAAAMFARLANAEGNPKQICRELTTDELKLFTTEVELMLVALQKAWADFMVIEPRYDRYDSNPMQIRVAPPGEKAVMVTFDIRIGAVEGLMNFCLPLSALEPIMGKLAGEVSDGPAVIDDEIPLASQLAIELPSMTVADVLQLREGQTLPIPPGAAARPALVQDGQAVLRFSSEGKVGG